ncbi:hypothetical protein O181_019606 [Austropuccinia psidii MF-1]|uniref:Reverse transcriptase Ty1/copia-type domain-containing protein n=1 Tax=Austropuccinia psidii MF-1 TaxID=1389203 RepID=A0A9Q3GU10_9BASI|nr:hypothetical protein [Austropuccinia psidii MF-1]
MDKLLNKYGMFQCHPVLTPMIPNSHLQPVTDTNICKDFNYQKAIGSLNYLTMCSRLDLAFTTLALAQFLEKPLMDHVAAFKRVLKYLQGTRDFCLMLDGNKGLENLEGYCDSDWGSNFDGKSFSGHGIQCGGLIAWKTKKHPIVSLSSTEA